MNFFFLMNPLETFKSFVYDFQLIELSSPLYFSQIPSSIEHFYNPSVLFTHDLILSIFQTVLFFETSFIVVYLACAFLFYMLISHKNVIAHWNAMSFTIIFVICSQIIIYLFNIEVFIHHTVYFDDMTLLPQTYSSNNYEEDFRYSAHHKTLIHEVKNITYFGIINILFIKESLSFFSLFLMWWLFANWSFASTLLNPKTIIEMFDELLYKKNLNLFVDTLQIKQHPEIKNYQEFFFKVHGILLFILIANVQGMVPYSSTITSSLMNTFYIALAVFINIIYTLIREKGIAHLFSLFLPAGCPFNLVFLLNPIEFISYSFRLISLSVRLFANMMAGHTLMKVIAGFSWSLILLGDHYVLLHYVPFIVLFLLTFLEIAVGFIQTYIFVILVYIYLSDIFIAH